MKKLTHTVDLLVTAKLHPEHVSLILLTVTRGQDHRALYRADRITRSLLVCSFILYRHLLTGMGKSIKLNVPVGFNGTAIDLCNAVSG